VSYRGRIAALSARLDELGVDALLVTARTNVCYLTGFGGTNGVVLVGPDGAMFLTDFRYLERAEPVREFAEVRRSERDILAWAAEHFAELAPGAGRLGVEGAHLPVAGFRLLESAIDAELVVTVGAVERLRLVKDDGELAAIRRAAAVLEGVYAALADEGLAGRTEADVAWRVAALLHQAGADDVSFPPIVAAAENGAQPHAEPRRVPIPRDCFVTLDIGARLDGYASDCTRTLAVGDPPDDLLAVYDLCLRAQAEALAAVRAGARAADVDAVARDVIAGAGHGDHFGHPLGHGVGLDIHEAPRLGPGQDTVLAPGMVVTIEPGIYVPGRGGVRIEDLVIVTDDGAERVTGYPKELVRTS
jgi:Xaa-Pro aminopeptidase